MRYLFAATALILSGTLFAQQDSNARLLTEEERDARLLDAPGAWAASAS